MPDLATPLYRAARVDCALQERTLTQHAAFARSRWFAFYAEAGHTRALTQGGDYELTGPALLWGPLDGETRLKIAAGGVGHYLFLSDAALTDALGGTAEAADLRHFAQAPVLASFGRGDRLVGEIDTLFERIVAEAAQPQFGAEAALAAYVRLLLVLLRRSVAGGARGTPPPAWRSSQINRFRSLVEAHFRSRWKVAQYAEALGMSYDRLHDLCLRAVGRPPASLLRERALHEAQVLLGRTTLSAERISAMLGFASASQFSHFFKAASGETPGSFRRRLDRLSRAAAEAEVARFSDWP